MSVRAFTIAGSIAPFNVLSELRVHRLVQIILSKEALGQPNVSIRLEKGNILM